MFTGLIEAVCPVRAASTAAAGGAEIVVDLGPLAEGVRTGESIAIDGVCLTVSRLSGTAAAFGLSGETLGRSTLGKMRAGKNVNVERAMKVTDRFGGHIVQGHADGTATIRSVRRSGEFADIVFGCQATLLEQMVVKGSVAVDGISLTISQLNAEGFGVAVIPETWKRTTLAEKRIGDEVNVETDMIVKVIRKYLEAVLPRSEGLTVEKLREMGY